MFEEVKPEAPTKVHPIRISIEVWDKLEEYIKTMEKEEGVSFNKRKFFDKLLTDFFKDKLVTNTTIPLKEPYYFNYRELLKNKTVECTTEQPTTNLESYYIIKNIPNNLDKWNGSYYYKHKGNHKGILFDYNEFVKFEATISQNKEDIQNGLFLVFFYEEENSEDGTLYKTPKLTIKLVVPKYLNKYLGLEYKNLANSLNKELTEFKQEIYKFVLAEQKVMKHYSENGFDKEWVYAEENEEDMQIFIKNIIMLSFRNYDCFIPLNDFLEMEAFYLEFKDLSETKHKELQTNLNFSIYDVGGYLYSFYGLDPEVAFRIFTYFRLKASDLHFLDTVMQDINLFELVLNQPE